MWLRGGTSLADSIRLHYHVQKKKPAQHEWPVTLGR
jgi:hypothetical protein